MSPPSGTVLERLSLPELEGLGYWDDSSEFDGSTVLDLIERSHPRITTLSLRAPRIQDVVIIGILRRLPTLLDLDIVSCPVTIGLMTALDVCRKPRPPSVGLEECVPIICPELRTLHLFGKEQHDIKDGPAECPVVSIMVMIASCSSEKGTLNKTVLYTDCNCKHIVFADHGYKPLMECFLEGGAIIIATEDGEGEDEDEGEE